MSGYRYNCQASPFGCMITRCRKEAMAKHEKVCPLMMKYRTYIEAKKQVPLLEKQIDELQIKLSKIMDGQCRIELEHVDIRWFHKEILNDKKLLEAWKKLFASQMKDGVEAMIVLFLAKSKRFWKISQCKNYVDIKGFFGCIRTKGQIHTVTIAEFASCMYQEFADFIDTYLPELGYKDGKEFELEKLMRMKSDCSDCKFAIRFVRNALYNEVRRRRKKAPVQYKNIFLNL